MKKHLCVVAMACLSLALSACGGGGGGAAPGSASAHSAVSPTTASGANPVDSGVAGSSVANQVVLTAGGQTYDTFNRAYVSVTLCVPGTTTCQTIPDVVVDTGSTGLRIFASALSPAMLSGLPEEMSQGVPVNECAMFAGGNMWGTVRTADVAMAGEQAAATPIQVVQDGVAPVAPACASAAGSFGMISAPRGSSGLGGNGLIGLDALMQDCGSYCAAGPTPYYYAGAGEVAVALAQQVTNPVTRFSQDNNGVLLTLPAIPAAGAVSVTGTMTFGVDTQPDNTLGALGLAQYAASGAGLSASYGSSGASMSAIFDSGSPMYYFEDASLPICSGSQLTTSMYCPSAATTLHASISGSNGTTATIDFSVDNASNLLFQSPTNYAYDDLAQASGSTPALSGFLDMGLPFFFGRSVGVVFQGMPTYEGTGPAIVF